MQVEIILPTLDGGIRITVSDKIPAGPRGKQRCRHILGAICQKLDNRLGECDIKFDGTTITIHRDECPINFAAFVREIRSNPNFTIVPRNPERRISLADVLTPCVA